MEAIPEGCFEKVLTKIICSSHSQPLLGKVKTAGQGCDFHGSFAAIPGTPSCVFFMQHILLTNGLLQAHSGNDNFMETIFPSLCYLWKYYILSMYIFFRV
jgi:hypothetical protein